MSDPVADTYRRYKSGTAKLIRYLVDTAKLSDKVVAASIAQRYSESKHKTGSAATDIEIKFSTSDLLRFAKSIRASPDVALGVPPTIIGITQEVIALRKECAQWYSADEGHEYFIGVLKEILGLLQPRTPLRTTKSRTGKLSVLNNAKRTSNMYTELPEDVEEEQLPDANFVSLFSVSPTIVKTSSTSGGKADVRYSLEDIEGEISLAYFCFLKDLHSIRQYVLGKWRDYVAGDTSLTSVSVVTNAAFGLIRIMEAKLRHQFPCFTDFESLQAFAIDHPHADASSGTSTENIGPEQAENHGINEKELLCVDTNALLQRYKSQMQSKEKVYSPFYPNADLFTPDVDKNAPLDAILTEASLFFFHFFYTMCSDELLGDIFSIAYNQAVSISVVSSARILVDINLILGDARRRPFEDLRKAAADVMIRNREHVGTKYGFQEAYQAETSLSSITFLIQEWIISDGMAGLRDHTATEFPPQIPYQLFNAHPILCGLLANYILTQTHEESLRICSAERTLVAAAHIFNAARKSGLLRSKWSDMDQVIQFQGADQIFIGEAPSKPNEMCSRAYLASGFPAHWFSKDSQKRPKHLSDSVFKPTRELKVTSPYIKTIDSLQEQHRISPYQWDLMNYAELIAKNCFNAMRKNEPTGTTKESTTRWREKTRLDQVQLLEALHDCLVAEEPHIHYDYLKMHHMCHLILEDLREALQDRIKDYLEVDDTLIGTKPSALAPLILEAASRESRTMLFRSTIIAKVAGKLESILNCALGCGEDKKCMWRQFCTSATYNDIDSEGRLQIGQLSLVERYAPYSKIGRRTAETSQRSLGGTSLAFFHQATLMSYAVRRHQGKGLVDILANCTKTSRENAHEYVSREDMFRALRALVAPRGKNAVKNKKSSEKRKAKRREKTQLRELREVAGESTSQGAAEGASETSEKAEGGTESAEEDSEYIAAALKQLSVSSPASS